MTISIDTVATLAKAFGVKREKNADDVQEVIAHLKFAECFVPRETIDELCRQPVGWSESWLFDEFGAPRLVCEIALPRASWQASVTLRGPDGQPTLAVTAATLDGVTLTPSKLGAVMAGQLAWVARGDEVEDVTDMLGAIVTFRATLHDGGQQDLLQAAVRTFVDTVADAGGGSIKGEGIDIEIPARRGKRAATA